jgi:membrane protein implicated in regulation of membrane protease activity
MSLAVFWIIAACILGVGEILTLGLYLAPFALGAGLAAVVAALGGGLPISLVVFLASSVALLTLVRPLARSHHKAPPALRTGTAALVGRQGVVLERIANHEGVGCVKVNGEVWTARAYDDEDVIEAGTPVQVLDIRGATALVSE